jgi:uncharacterized membrane protein YgdD (TMEM256/DUF423 family)
MNQRTILLFASMMGVVSVALGAFGAHAFKETLLANGRLDTYELAVRYQYYHTFALLAVGILAEKFPRIRAASLFFLMGTVIFSGSLYVLALTGQTLWGAVTPLGGIGLIAGWMMMARGIYQQKN